MYTLTYKGSPIQGYLDRAEVYLFDPLACNVARHFKSLHAAKCFITRYMIPAYSAGSYRAVG